MIEFVVLGRFIADYLWEYKALSILHTVISLLFLGIYVFFLQRKIRFFKTDALIFLFFIIISFSFICNFSHESWTEYLKFSSFLIFYFLGRFSRIKISHLKYFAHFSYCALFILMIFVFSGYGYQEWGYVLTFTGGYYFKADLALACLIFIGFIYAYERNKIILFSSFIICLFLVFMSNSRVALPIALVMPVMMYFFFIKKYYLWSVRSIVFSSLLVFISMSFFIFLDFSKIGMLGFDFSNPLSGENTQGRSAIWSALFEYYSKSDIFNKFFGLGLTSDTEATTSYIDTEQLSGARAHSSYFYLLLASGSAGLIVFLYFSYCVIKSSFYLAHYGNEFQVKISSIGFFLILIFLFFSLTVEVIIRPQLMVILFYFSGLIFTEVISLKRSLKLIEKR